MESVIYTTLVILSKDFPISLLLYFDNKSIDIGKYTHIEIGEFLYCKKIIAMIGVTCNRIIELTDNT